MDTFKIYIEDTNTGAIRLTSKGRRMFETKFASVGIAIDSIRTKTEFTLAYDRFFNDKMFTLGKNNRDPYLDNVLQEIPAYRKGMEIRGKVTQ